ncbi:bifunctional diguanylate cyclase/phosphodiesterase [Couchioplanes caeruleus]|uniref:putative bifunctional diguanylate cyclase/phosphodiesterase n=1 Tax=Couchioplanes caeruleus TaxID=56438 RepID=UPI0020BFF642|nr:bifunctional diguanylate cyclase/phosphodiesterase [Couchioplanes caeruleus]UQU61429.1 bifunctional diguanylate cyclase/phosphodiesterase [Couchioplanes caeruleus]
MTAPATRVGRRRAQKQARPGPLPLAVAVLALAWSLVWLTVQDGGTTRPGYAGGPLAMLGAFLACRRIGAMIVVARPVRSFWRWFANAAICLGAGAAISFALANNRPGLSPYVAAPIMLGVAMALLAFLQLPRERRSSLRWTQLVLDGATVAVSGTLIFWYVVFQLADPATSPATLQGAAVVGVGGLIALVVIGRAAMSPASVVDPLSLRMLAVAPLTGVVSSVLLIAGSPTARLWLSVLSVPLVGLAMCLAAYRQQLVLGRPGVTAVAPARRSVYNALPLISVIATAALVITVSARQLDSHQRVVIVGAVLIAAFVVARQLLGLRANERMLGGIRRQQAELERLAMHDPLTGLANRARFGTVLGERLDAHLPASVLLVDIDDFKMVNDTMGHAVGDQLLYEVAQRLRHHSAVTHLPSRLGGDEFAVLLDTDEPVQAEAAAARILAALAVPFRVGEHHLLAHASIGVALAGPGDSADEMLRNADIAMYAAKASGKASYARFEPRMRNEVVNHARLGSELHNAIIRHELYLMYQPVFDITTGRMSGAEALVRWRHPVRGNVSPGDFIPVAERSGLIVPLGSWVLREACEQLARWHAEYGPAAIRSINVNVAARQLRESGFVDEVAAVLSDTGLVPANLVLEVTESSVVDGRQVRDTLEALHELGVRLALDDFGTGQSSLSLLRAFPVDVLKLDKSFVDGICDGEDRGRLAVAAAVAQLAEYLDLYAVAEGIETAAQLERLRQMGYRLGQGYYMAKPLPPAEMAALMVRTATAVPV